ncbi:putative Histidine kinase [Candidatus Terasakiella magnetica]|uniref:histidine kinase n=1 Tax=Candidatus Terasakiella magnetica TaxID=1867952 RepID=A0A1C3RKX0_9PROT|nr:NahK/ErcS family hybrid sensor histidine kinase/response regulator [Candidatus Terasakiella magnetica]SCA57970.1 putative Histidine kinase [Candidatus Terasakiella magnetica]
MSDALKKLQEENAALKEHIATFQKRDELYTLAMEVPNEGLWDWNPITKELLISSRLMETLGHTSKTKFTTTNEWLDWVHPDDVAGYEAKVSEHLKGLSDYFEWEYRVKDTNGKYHWVLARGKALRDEKGLAYRMVGSVGDITQRRQAEDELKRSHELLEERVAERTSELVRVNRILNEEIKERKVIEKELKAAKEEAENANISKNKYLAAASHDLLQPMNAARILITTLQERILKPENQSLVTRIHYALESAEDLLIDLLDIAKLDAHAMSVDVQNCPANRVMYLLEKEIQSVAKKASVELVVVECSLGFTSDVRLLGRILRNFLNNAIRHASGGKVLLGCRRVGKNIRFEVWDNGCGIPKDKLKIIFEEFKQLKPSGSHNEQGVGLGLAIVERISVMLDHKVDVRSQVGKGSVFSVEVPACEINKEIQLSYQPSSTEVVQDLAGKEFLIVDNESSITHSMSVLLQEWGAVPYCALSLRAAVTEVDSNRISPVAILADYHLNEDETGLEVIDAVHRLLGKNIPAAIITADRSQELLTKCKSKGISVLNKPIKPAKLRALLSFLTRDA